MDKTLERAMMGWFLRGENLEDIRKLEVSDFQDEACRRIFEGLKQNPNISMMALAEQTGIHIGELAEMTQSDRISHRWYTDGYNEIMRIKRNKCLMDNPELSADEIVAIAKKYSEKTPQVLPKPETDMVLNYLELLDKRQTEELVKSGFKLLDEKICGIRRGELTSVGARPGNGKSTFALDVAEAVINQGKKVLLFSLEMSIEQIMDRLMVRKTNISIHKLRKGELEKKDWAEVSVAIDKIHNKVKEGNLLIFRENKLSIIKELVKVHKPYLIIIDQLEQLRDNISFVDKRQRFSHMTNNLKRMALDNNICIMLLAQLNRDAENKMPTLANLKESGSIEEDSDNVILLHSVDSDCVDFSGNFNGTMVHTNLAKHRNGETGEFFVVFNKERCRFENIS